MQARCEQHDSNMDFVQAVQFDGALLGVRGGMRTVPCWARSRRILKSNARQDFFHRGDDQTPAHHRVFRIGAYVSVCVARRCVLRSVECIAVGSAEEGAAGMRAVSVSEEQQTQVFREGLPLPASSFHQARTCA